MNTLLAAAVLLLSTSVFADEDQETKEDVKNLRQRVENLEKGQQIDEAQAGEMLKTLQKGKKFQEDQQKFLDDMERDGEL